MKSSVICIGDEILIGQIADTNSRFIAQRLNSLGIECSSIKIVGDDKKALVEVINEESKRSDLIILSGGLGPTNDDITREAIAYFLSEKLIFSKQVFENIKEVFKKFGRTDITNLNKQQAYIPESCTFFQNDIGTAPAIVKESEKFILVAFPGVPSELIHLFEKLEKFLTSKYEFLQIYHKTVSVFGIPESKLALIISSWEKNIKKNNISLSYLPKKGIVRLRLTTRGKDKLELKKKINSSLSNLKKIIDFSYHDIAKLEHVIHDLLYKRGLTISCAESCTAGEISSIITKASGSSKYFKGGLVVYSNFSKVNLLNVDLKKIEKYGVVSEEVAKDMSQKCLEKFDSDFSISTTGLMEIDNTNKGILCISFSSKTKTLSKKLELKGNREQVTEQSTILAIEFLISGIMDKIL